MVEKAEVYTEGLKYETLWEEMAGKGLGDLCKEFLAKLAVKVDKPWILEALELGLSDMNTALITYSDAVLENLVKTYIRFDTACWSTYFDVAERKEKFANLLEYTQRDRYTIEAAEGVRVATATEVNEAIFETIGGREIKLVNSPDLTLSEKDFKLLNTIAWLFSGRWRYYLKAGFECEFFKGKLKRPEMEYIISMLPVINRVCELFEQTNGQVYYDLEEKLRHIKKAGKYKYPDFATDEVVPTFKIAYVYVQLKKMLDRRKKAYDHFGKCSYLVKEKNLNELSTEDKLLLREYYLYLTNPGYRPANPEEVARAEKVMDICKELGQLIDNGAVSKQAFAVKVMTTLIGKKGRFASDKQINILVEAIDKAKREQEAIKIHAEAQSNAGEQKKSEFSLSAMSDMLGKGIV